MRFFWIAVACIAPVVYANEHSQCYCTVDDLSNRCVTEKACEVYASGMQIFENYNPENVNVTMLWHVCASLNVNKDGKVAYVSAFGGNEFLDACEQGASSCSDASGKKIGSECD
ncbi:hypothetical protein B0T10DRAFT_568704 [Thelonectria olida]|uniref:Sodefrin-like factor n=1 Tax=Thelonectria olida TaxID=1576542 RepID=A0A9P8VP50_9HYPO|nr:hypothetical protein B0T10DRAFT_568704 [Thelonectria olida]